MSIFNDNTRKQTWFLLLFAMVMWMFAGMILMTPDKNDVIPISNPVVLGAYFGVLTAVMLPIGATAYKSYRETKLELENGNKENGEVPVTVDTNLKT